MIGWWFLFLLTLKEKRILSPDKFAIEAVNFIQMCSVLQQSFHLLHVSTFFFHCIKESSKEKASATMRLLFTKLNKFLRVCFF